MIVRLDAFLREVRVDPSLRRRLRSDAPSAFAERGFATADLPAALPASRNADVLLTHGQLFGVAPAAPLAEPGLELRLLAYGLKPLVLVHGLEAELQATMAWAESRGFTALLAADEWDRGSDDGKGGYSNLATGLRRARAGSGAWRSILVGADEDHVMLGWLALTLGWDEMLGRLLGYPACCATAFARRWKHAVESHQGDVIVASWYMYDESGGPSWLTAALSKTAPRTYTGALDSTTGPPINSVPFDPSRVTHRIVGSATMTFADGNNGTFAYTLNGVSQSKAIAQFVFRSPGTVCQ